MPWEQRPKWSFEDKLLTALMLIIAAIILYWIVGCTSTMGKTATLKYRSQQDCEWRLSGIEAIRAEQIGAELEVGKDCTLKRKADASSNKKPPSQ